MRWLFIALFLAPYVAGRAVGPRVAAVLAAAALAVAWLAPEVEGRIVTLARKGLAALAAYVLGGLLVLWPFNRALADFRDWFAKDAGVVAGMTREDVDESLARRAVFKREFDGDWVIYRLEPRGTAGLHPLLGFASLDLYVMHVRFDPQTRLALEVTRIE